jgi:hypothetical protein
MSSMQKFFAYLQQLYTIPIVHSIVAAFEGGAIGVITDGALDYNEIFQPHGLKHLATAIVIGGAIAVRNELKNRPGSPAGPTPPGK